MKLPPDKAQLRKELEQATRRFLHDGGKVEKIARGISGHSTNTPPAYIDAPLFSQPRQSRTPVPDVIAAIDSRRAAAKRNTTKAKPVRSRRRRKVIYDDFGAPLRHVWIDE